MPSPTDDSIVVEGVQVFGRGKRRTIIHVSPGHRDKPVQVQDVHMVPPAEALKEIRAREAALKKAAEAETAEALAKMRKPDASVGTGVPCSSAEQAVHDRVRKATSKIVENVVKQAETEKPQVKSGATTAKTEAHSGDQSFQETIPGKLVIDAEEVTSDHKMGGGNGGGFNNPPRFGGSGGGRGNSGTMFPPQQGWMFAFAALLFILIAFLVIGVKRDLYKEDAKKALSLAQETKVEVNAIAGDVSFGVSRLAITNKKVAEIGDTVTGATVAIASLSNDLSATNKELDRTKNAVKILADAVVDPQALAENASKVSKLEGDIKSLKRSDAKLAATAAQASTSADQANNGVAGVRVEVNSLKSELATLSKVVQESTFGLRGSMNVPQKGTPYNFIKPTSMRFMDGSKTSSAEERVQARVIQPAKSTSVNQKFVPVASSSQEPVVTEYIPNYHQPVITSFGR
jgi:methyl-accepting chemotaxis protein